MSALPDTVRDGVIPVLGELTSLERLVLDHLLLHAGDLVHKADLATAIYDDEDAVPASNVLEVIVSRLRRKLSAAGVRLRIVTARARGYRIEATDA